MAALTFPELENGDSIEIRQYKARVLKAAMKYKATYRWCSEIVHVLSELDIDPEPRKAKIKVVTTLGESNPFYVAISPMELMELSETEQMSVLAEKINDALTYKSGDVLGPKLKFSADSIVSMEMSDPDGHEVELIPGYDWSYTSDDGRVMHAWMTGATRWDGSVCGKASYGHGQKTSRRSEGRYCERCVRRVTRGLGLPVRRS